MKKSINIILLTLGLALSSVASAQEGMHFGANETFKYWTGSAPWKGIKVVNGQYWASNHFTKEYKMYMEVKVPINMATNFITDNKLTPIDDKIKYPADAPGWFTPTEICKEYKAGTQGSKYFIDLKTGYMFMYEIQL